ncbi:MAG: glycosyltransferase [Pseudomonadota bacterium]
MNQYAIVMFAHNEAANLAASVDAVHKTTDHQLDQFIVLANGCTDATVEIAKELKERLDFSQMDVVELERADKCNAWNTYVHYMAKSAMACHFFVDADVRFSTGAFPKMMKGLDDASSNVNVIGGMPLSGRNVTYYQQLLRERSCFFGNLYGMHPRFLDRLRETGFRLPIGLNWIDSFLTKAANTDLGFGRENLPERVISLEGVGFEFTSLSPLRPSDFRLYWNRIARYELGKLQEVTLDELPPSEWPADMDEINADIATTFDERTRNLGWFKRYLVRQRLAKLLAHR